MSISVEAAEARDSLSDDKELIHTYEVSLLLLLILLLFNLHPVLFFHFDSCCLSFLCLR